MYAYDDGHDDEDYDDGDGDGDDDGDTTPRHKGDRDNGGFIFDH